MKSSRVFDLPRFPGFLISHRFNFILIFIGIGLRFHQYAQNCPLWLDEAWVAVDITSRSLSEIIHFVPIVHPYHPPVGFVLMCKLLTQLIGNQEWILRLLPFCSSILSVVLYAEFLRKYFDSRVRTMALALFVFCDPLIMYAAQLKEYSTDVFMTLLIYMLIFEVERTNWTSGKAGWLGFGGMVILWFSYPAIFVLAGIGLTLLIFIIMNKEWEKLSRAALTLALWLWSFVFLCLKVLLPMKLSQQTMADRSIKEGLPPDGTIGQILLWLGNAFLRIFVNPGGLYFSVLAAALFIVGCRNLFRKDAWWCLLLLMPILLVLLAGTLNMFPLTGRLLLFILPAVFIFIAEGILCFFTVQRRLFFIMGCLISGLLFFHPVKEAAAKLIQPRCHTDNRTIMQYFKKYYQPQDAVMLNSGAVYQFWYYVNQLNIISQMPETILDPLKNSWKGIQVEKFYDSIGNLNGAEYAGLVTEWFLFNEEGKFRDTRPQGQLIKIFYDTQPVFDRKERTWLIFSHVKPYVKKFILNYFDHYGQRIQELETQGAAIYLYDMTRGKN